MEPHPDWWTFSKAHPAAHDWGISVIRSGESPVIAPNIASYVERPVYSQINSYDLPSAARYHRRVSGCAKQETSSAALRSCSA
jgi:hypothetical protein